jgi:hypothetical protein
MFSCLHNPSPMRRRHAIRACQAHGDSCRGAYRIEFLHPPPEYWRSSRICWNRISKGSTWRVGISSSNHSLLGPMYFTNATMCFLSGASFNPASWILWTRGRTSGSIAALFLGEDRRGRRVRRTLYHKFPAATQDGCQSGRSERGEVGDCTGGGTDLWDLDLRRPGASTKLKSRYPPKNISIDSKAFRTAKNGRK